MVMTISPAPTPWAGDKKQRWYNCGHVIHDWTTFGVLENHDLPEKIVYPTSIKKTSKIKQQKLATQPLFVRWSNKANSLRL